MVNFRIRGFVKILAALTDRLIGEGHRALPLTIILLVVSAGLLYCCLNAPLQEDDLPPSGFLVRVILKHAYPGESLEFGVAGPYKIFGKTPDSEKGAPGGGAFRDRDVPTYTTRGSLIYGYRLQQGKISYQQEGKFHVNGIATGVDRLTIVPQRDGDLSLGARQYRGIFELSLDEEGRLRLLNAVDLEHYLAGVLFEEMPASFPDEALKAQVIASRSYALHRILTAGGYLTDDTLSQVYGGCSRETAKGLALVRATRGRALYYEERVLEGLFSSTCGGFSSRARDAFSGRAPAPLEHSRICGFCGDSPVYTWTRTFTLADLADRLELPPEVERFSLAVTESNPSRRASEISVLDARGQVLKRYRAGAFRSRLNKDRPRDERLLSALIDEISQAPDGIVINGRGWGHGVGLCQYGARGLARRGRSCDQILAYYYPGASIVDDYGIVDE